MSHKTKYQILPSSDSVSDAGLVERINPRSTSNQIDHGTVSNQNPTAGSKQKSAAAKGSKGKPIWTTEDDIKFLQGMKTYMMEKKEKPSDCKFQKFVNENLELSMQLDRKQLSDKIYRIRTRYEANMQKGGGDANLITNSTKRQVFELSKGMFGPGTEMSFGFPVKARKPRNKQPGSSGASALPVPDAQVASNHFQPQPGSSEDTENGLQLSNFERRVIVDRMSLGDEKAQELAAQWHGWMEEEVELRLKKTDLVKRQRQVALDIIRASRE